MNLSRGKYSFVLSQLERQQFKLIVRFVKRVCVKNVNYDFFDTVLVET